MASGTNATQFWLLLLVTTSAEQALVTCMYNGHCPKCTILAGQLCNFQLFSHCVQNTTFNTYVLADGDVHPFIVLVVRPG